MRNAAASGDNADLCLPFIKALSVTGASISVFSMSGAQSTVCSSDAIATRIDELQLELGEGPQWQTMRTGRSSLVGDIDDAVRATWPMFGDALAGLHVGALFAIPLTMGAVTLGVVGLYRTSPGALGERELAAAVAMAGAVAGAAVRQAVIAAENDGTAESTHTPAMRREVHQATGMILVQLDTNATIAYSRLRAHAFVSGRTVRDVARDVVDRRIDFARLPL